MKTETGVNINTLLAKIDFSADNVINAASQQPVLFLQAIEFRIKCLRDANIAKMVWERERAAEELLIRKDALQSGMRVTEGNIDAQLLVNQTISDLGAAHSRAAEMDEYSKLIVEAFRMRRDCLRIIGDLTRDDLSLQRASEESTEKMRETRRKLKEKFPG